MNAKYFLKKIKKEFPTLSWANYKYITSGFDHDVIILDNKLVFRFPKSKEYIEILKNEIKFLKYFSKKTKISVPSYTHVFKNFSGAAYPILPGTPLTTSRFKNLSLQEKKLIAKQLANFIDDSSTISKSVIKKFCIPQTNYLKRLKILDKEIKKYIFAKFNKKEIKVTENYLKEVKKDWSINIKPIFLHNDLAPSNILYDKKNKTIHIIDFSDRTFGHPAVNFSGLLNYGEKFTKQVLNYSKFKNNKNIIYSSRLFFKAVDFDIMLAGILGIACSYKDGYVLFRKDFKLSKKK